jgi:predicted negative regulator of RcsB-dependent stress response
VTAAPTRTLSTRWHAATSRWGNRYYVARSLDNLGDTYHASGDQSAAHDAWRQAEAVLDEIQHPAVRQVRDKLAGVTV